jgi:divalent metal cation (Fe/Co/Zn/Cd) transporter
MPVFKDVVMIKDRPFDRAVEVTVIYPEDMNVTNVQELAEKAWRSVNKTITIGDVTVKVRGFGR